jgi:catechol 2,3-dioxygenase-like lactoylglutathione lyase family enzyme
MSIKSLEVILYVSDQARSRDFYREVLGMEPSLDVPGMTEFDIAGAKLGLMPASGIKVLLADVITESDQAISRCELYLVVDDPIAYAARARSAGAMELSSLQLRDWGDEVAYFADQDSHVIAFARKAVLRTS